MDAVPVSSLRRAQRRGNPSSTATPIIEPLPALLVVARFSPEDTMHIKTGLFALALGTALSTAAFAQYRPDDRNGGGFSNQGQSQSQGGGRYDPSTGGRYPADERAYRYRSRDRFDDDDDDY